MFDLLDAVVLNFELLSPPLSNSRLQYCARLATTSHLHRQTIARRGNHPAAEAIADVEFMAARALACVPISSK
jgi:hypothetical protein